MIDDKRIAKKSESITPINSRVVRKKSGLVKSRMPLKPELKRQQVRVQIGGASEDSFSELFSAIIKDVVKDKYNLSIVSSSHGEELLELAGKDDIDIFIFIMNNIRFAAACPVEDRLENSLKLITQIKTTYGRPIIALSGLKEDSSLIARTKLVADFYLQLPFKNDALKEVFEKCLEIITSVADCLKRGSKRAWDIPPHNRALADRINTASGKRRYKAR